MMPALHVNYKAVLLAAGAALVVGAPEWMKPQSVNPWEVLGELARSLLIAYVFARFFVRSRIADWKGAFVLAGTVWFAFQATILLGSLLHEHMPFAAYALRAGYALVSALVIVAVLGAWQFRQRPDESVASRASGPTRETGALARAEPGINIKAVALAAVAAIVVGALWYSPLLFGAAWAELNPSAGAGGAKVPPAAVLGELVRSGIVAYALARFAARFRISDWKGTVLLGGWVWLGFHATLILFSVIHQDMPLKLYAIHAGHGLANELVITAILGAWRRKA